MKYLRVVDQHGNKQDYETEFVPRIGETILLRYGIGKELVADHYFRVKDVMYRLDAKIEHQVAVLIEEVSDWTHWPT